MSNILTLFWFICISGFVFHIIRKFKKDKFFKLKIIFYLGFTGMIYIPLTMVYCYSHPMQNVPDCIELLYKAKRNIVSNVDKIDRKAGNIIGVKQAQIIYNKSGIKNMARMTTKVTRSYGIKTPVRESKDTIFTKGCKGLYKGVQLVVGIFS